MAKCSSTLEIQVQPGPPPTFMRYWTMDETGNVTPRVDKVNGDELNQQVAIFADIGSGVGKVGNAVRFPVMQPNPPYNQGYVVHLANFTNAPPLPIVGAPASLSNSNAFWLKETSVGGLNAELYTQLEGYLFGNRTSYVGISYYNNHFVFYWEIGGGGYQEVVIATPDTNWHFWHLFYDYSASKVGYSVDNGAESTFAVPFQPPGTVDGYWSHSAAIQSTNNQPFADWMIDEYLAYMGAKLTPAQVTYLYNGGAGRTWPIVLPP